MPLSWNEIKSRAVEFSKEWEDEKSEDAEAKSFWDGFFNVFGLTRRRLASFEVEVKKRGGNSGFIDLFWPGVLLVEHKSRGRSLEKAYVQAMDYFPGISEKDLPKYILVSDFEKFKLYDIEEDKEIEFTLKELPKKVNLFGFLAGYKKQEYKEEDEVNIKAAELMGRLYDAISEAGYQGHELNVLLVRILFCLFAEDANIFNNYQFRKYIETRTNIDGSDLGMHLNHLFQIFNTPKEKRQTTLDEELSQFEYVNGGLFEENISIPSFTSGMRERLLEACSFNWSSISPAIFGSLFQSVMDKDARRHLGAHYTSEKNILKLIKPLFLDELQSELDACGKNNKSLFLFQEKLSKLKFLDPACGCGNFLIIAYRELRLLELEVLKRRFGTARMLPFEVKELIKVRPEQFFGIEIDDFPARITQTAMWLMDHQMNEIVGQTFGRNIPDLPLTKGANVFVGNALQKDWEEVVPKNELSYILGNPPFIGERYQNEAQRKDLEFVFGEKVKLDYVAGWYFKAAQYIKNTRIKVAFVSTNSVVQGEQINILWSKLFNKYNIKINFAHKTFKWNNEARGKAAVFCVIIGFANFDEDKKYLYEYESLNGEPHEIKVKNINPYLVDADNIFIDKKSKPICNVPIMQRGSDANDKGFLLFTESEMKDFINKEPESSTYFKRAFGASEYINNRPRYTLWLENIDPSVLRGMKFVTERILEIKKFRSENPHLYGSIRKPKSDFLFVPQMSSENREYIPIGFLDVEAIPLGPHFFIDKADLYHFGILTSKMHNIWIRTVCGRLKSDLRYSNSLVYNNFPWPENPSTEKIKAVEKCAQEILDVRVKYPTSSLADLYDPLTMPADLIKAHQNLDKAVDSAYGKHMFKSSAERMNFLFELYEKYTSPLISKIVKKDK